MKDPAMLLAKRPREKDPQYLRWINNSLNGNAW